MKKLFELVMFYLIIVPKRFLFNLPLYLINKYRIEKVSGKLSKDQKDYMYIQTLLYNRNWNSFLKDEYLKNI